MSEIVTFAKISEIEANKLLVKRFGRKRIAVCSFEDKFYAFKDSCTHDGGTFDQETVCGKVIECPRHGAKFDITNGHVLSAPAYSSLETYPVTIVGDEIKIELE